MVLKEDIGFIEVLMLNFTGKQYIKCCLLQSEY